VCTGFKAPDFIDPKFLDPRFAFAEVEDEAESANKISSLKKLLDIKRNRSGYGERETLY
jgi:AdoMet-dependent rRNA methyltransferase SPB1